MAASNWPEDRGGRSDENADRRFDALLAARVRARKDHDQLDDLPRLTLAQMRAIAVAAGLIRPR